MGMRWDAVRLRVYSRDCARPPPLVLLLHKLQFGKAMGGKRKVYGSPKACINLSLPHPASFGSTDGLLFMKSVLNSNSYSRKTASGNHSSRRAREY